MLKANIHPMATKGQILKILGTTTEPLTTLELLELFEVAVKRMTIVNALRVLQDQGYVQQVGMKPVTSPNNKYYMAPCYQLT